MMNVAKLTHTIKMMRHVVVVTHTMARQVVTMTHTILMTQSTMSHVMGAVQPPRRTTAPA
jgi:hypothetical protein